MPRDLGVRVDVLQVPTEGFTLKLLPQSSARRDVTVVYFGHTWTRRHTHTKRSNKTLHAAIPPVCISFI